MYRGIIILDEGFVFTNNIRRQIRDIYIYIYMNILKKKG